MKETRVKISSIVENQLPQFVREEFPLASEFLSQYYLSLENQGGVSDLLQNIDQYIKVDNLTNLIDNTDLEQDVTFFDSSISVKSTSGFPDSYGLLLIDSEIITYTSKTSTTFDGCIRGFVGFTSYIPNQDLSFVDSEAQEHKKDTQNGRNKVVNLSILFLKEFLKKVKKQVTPGFENRNLFSDLNERLFIKQSADFYNSKGTDNSFKILFGALYGENVEVIKPRDYLIQPSTSQYRVTSDLVVESIEGDPLKLVNGTLRQDKTDFINEAQGTITNVEKIRRGNKDYYTVSLDYDYDKDIVPKGSVFGKFSIHPKTKTVTNVFSGSTTLEVDSTVGFPEKNGVLLLQLPNTSTLTVTYKTKTLNQFIDCTGVTQDVPENTEVKSDFYAYGIVDESLIKVRILGVLSDLEIPENTKLYSKGNKVKIKSLGINLTDLKSNNWFLNIPTTYKVKSLSLSDTSDKSYNIITLDQHSFKVGDSVTLVSQSGVKQTGNIISLIDDRAFKVSFGSNASILDESLSYIAKKEVLKVLSKNYPDVNKYTSNVQNVYYDEIDSSLYISSPSLPHLPSSYSNNGLEIRDRSITFTTKVTGEVINLNKNHGLYTGDAVVYRPNFNNNLGISTGIYFVKKVSNTEIKLSRSRNNLFYEKFISFDADVSNAKFELEEFVSDGLQSQKLESQKLLRKISDPQPTNKFYETPIGLTGIFVNGVELLNYKSSSNVYYGPIEEIIPLSSGSGYDVINPPTVSITDQNGSGAVAYCQVKGGLERIDILDPGFDYLEDPKITITGGNGAGASAKANLVSFDHEVSFNSQSSAGLVELNPTNTIGFSTYHKFRDFEEVIYITNGQTSVGGLSTNSSYYVSVKDANTIKLHKSFSDASAGINTISLISYGNGIHVFKSRAKKKKIGSIAVDNSGFNYTNNLKTTTTVGINTSFDVISIKNHGYNSGEIIVYNATQNPIGGLTSSYSYYVTKIDENNFKLSEYGSESLGLSTDFYYKTKQFVKFTSKGSGSHIFNYPEIKVAVIGKTGVSTSYPQDFGAELIPVFRGGIESVFVESGGSGYGSEDIIDFNRQPLVELNSGLNAEVTPIIVDGKIQSVLVKSFGQQYTSQPDLQVSGSGSGAILTPVLSNGQLLEVKVINGGYGYDKSNTKIDVINPGRGAHFESKIKSWKINLVERLFSFAGNTADSDKIIPKDDGILTSGLNSNYGLQYAHAYTPRYLRTLVQSVSFSDGKEQFSPDLSIFNNVETRSSSHSPIIGWAYDGNPIYGPYGYIDKTGGQVVILKTGYQISLKSNRPSKALYPEGFFVEDYDYVGNGDLDEHNGRFCITPEYPNGVYAYFTTVTENPSENDPTFKNYRKPVFPYVIGNTFKSQPIEFNFDPNSNQDQIDINKTKWKRNTAPYNILNENSYYEYLLNPNSIKPQFSTIKTISSGSITSVDVLQGGDNYKVGDKVIFEDEKIKAKVSIIGGKKISNISIGVSSFDNVKLYQYENTLIGFNTVPHNYNNNDILTFGSSIDNKRVGTIKVTENILSLTSGIASAQSTGLVTYFNVSGNLNFPNIKENDFYQINNEIVKVLNVDPVTSRIRVIRNQSGTAGITSYQSGTILREKSRKFITNFAISTSYTSPIDNEFYFDPKESVGLGTTSGVGIVTTIYFSNPGIGLTSITIPTRSVYIPSHNIKTGDSLIYSSNGGSRISVSTDGISSFQLSDNSIVYATKISNDLIGISTVKVGIGSTGQFISIGSSIISEILYFTSVGTGNTHSFKTNHQNILNTSVSKNTVTVTTSENHNLSLFDKVYVDVKSGLTTTFIVKYSDYNRRLLINPKSFSDIDTNNGIITIQNHGYYSGQKVLYTSNTPSSGLVNERMYYVVVVDLNRFKLSNSYYDAIKDVPTTINILSSSAGTISQVNPNITLFKNQTVIFDLSDPSLSFSNNSKLYPAFEFKLYTDSLFLNEFDSTKSNRFFEVSKTGIIGIDSTAKVTLTLNDIIPKELYYNLVPSKDVSFVPDIKKEILSDTEVVDFNRIKIRQSFYSGNHQVIGLTTNTFSYNIQDTPEVSSYADFVEYYTESQTSSGPIKSISIINGGKNYTKLPNITSILTVSGKDSILVPSTDSIGKVTSIEIDDIGFDYPVDNSLRPTAKFSDILILESLSSFDYIGITSTGRRYTTSPSLVVLDGLTNQILDVDLKYSLRDSYVTILKNTQSLNNVTPKIIPINNSNGFKIKNITFDGNTNDVTVELSTSFSSFKDFPFFVGGKVLVEGVSVGLSTEGKGYNSSRYNYALFEIKSINPNIGGTGATVVYNLSNYLNQGEFPGTYNEFYSSAIIVPESYFPVFNPVLKKGDFYIGETVYSDSVDGEVEEWNPLTQYLKVSTDKDFSTNKKVKGKTSGSEGIIKEILNVDCTYLVDSSSNRRKGWFTETGFLNNDLQRIHDSDYYQYFSYDLKSKKDFNTWNDAVSSLNHTSGFKKFANLVIESNSSYSGISTEQNKGDFLGIADLSRTISVNCYSDFDLVRENNLILDGDLKSDQIIFNSRILQDYIESIGNRVLTIDDVSGEFNSNPRATKYSVVDTFDLDEVRSKKYIICVQDKKISIEKQISLVSLIHDGSTGFINQYGLETTKDLGFFDFTVFGSEGTLLFYPKKFLYNDYHVEVFSFSLPDIITGIGTINLGDSTKIFTNTVTVPDQTSSPVNIIGIGTTYRSSKVLVQIGSTDSSYYEYNEILFTHNDSEVEFLEYGEITTGSFSSEYVSGIGTYGAYISNGEVKIDFTPNNITQKEYVINTLCVSIASTYSSGIGTELLGGSSVNSSSVGIASSSNPTPTVIAKYSNLDYNCSYNIISVEDKTNYSYQVSELLSLSNPNDSYNTEFGIVETDNSIGITTFGISGSDTLIYFTPIENIEVEVKVFQVNLGYGELNESNQLDLI